MAIIDALYALASEIDAQEEYTRHHSRKVSEFATDIARNLGYSEEGIERIRTAARLHDIGKVGITISDKSPSENTAEWMRMRAHPYLGVVILRNIDGLEECIPAIHHHHESYDGTGYPDQLKGDDIPLDARILAVADTFDVMTSPRPNHSPYSVEDVLNYIGEEAGSLFDPRVVNAFLGNSVPEQTGATI